MAVNGMAILVGGLLGELLGMSLDSEFKKIVREENLNKGERQ